jgi:GNAT superfamily N-acetyltransferase
MAHNVQIDFSAVTVVAAGDEDQEFSYQVKKAAEGPLIAAVFGWDEGFQREYHSKEWSDARPDVIRYDGERIGTVRVRVEDGALSIGQFFILPEWQGRGVGSHLLRCALDVADKAGFPAKLAVLAGNRAEGLYRRFGFEVVRREGKLVHMERAAAGRRD